MKGSFNLAPCSIADVIGTWITSIHQTKDMINIIQIIIYNAILGMQSDKSTACASYSSIDVSIPFYSEVKL